MLCLLLVGLLLSKSRGPNGRGEALRRLPLGALPRRAGRAAPRGPRQARAGVAHRLAQLRTRQVSRSALFLQICIMRT